MYNISNITYYITIDSGAWRGAVKTRVKLATPLLVTRWVTPWEC